MYEDLETAAIEKWLANHTLCLEAGVNVGQLDRNKARAFRVELARRAKLNCRKD
jgi:hypothetical protein